ncbi:Mur ligase family protein [Sporosarcina sp. CAU 1771]
MKPLLIKDIRILLKGKLICGSENWKVTDAIYYKRHDLTKTHTLLFVNRNDTVNWNEINAKGPSLVISDKPSAELKKALSNTTVLKVESLIQSYWKFMTYYRDLFSIPVVTITGTCGKTTTKDMIAHILRKDYNVQASISSQNEPRRSLPYLVGIDENTDVAVFEHGLGNTGNIKHQCMIYQPTIGIITTIGVHHLDGCQDLEGYIRAKAEIVEGVKKDGTLILNADDENTKKIPLESFNGKCVYFGVSPQTDFRASLIEFVNHGMHFRLHLANKTYEVFIAGYGEHQVYNALAALAAVNEMGVDLKYAISRLSTYKNMKRHLEFSSGLNGSTIIDDTWTNNPTSIEAALKVLDSIGKGKKVVLILGDIKRLGNFEKKYHREIGTLIASRNIHTLITIGSKAEDIAKQAIHDGSKATVHMFKEVKDIQKVLEPILDTNTILLIKGPMSSRSMIQFADSLKI